MERIRVSLNVGKVNLGNFFTIDNLSLIRLQGKYEGEEYY